MPKKQVHVGEIFPLENRKERLLCVLEEEEGGRCLSRFAEVEKLKPTATILPQPGAIKGGDTIEQANYGTPTNRGSKSPGDHGDDGWILFNLGQTGTGRR